MSNVHIALIEDQIMIMKQYALMMLEREDFHGLWDAAIDLQRLYDKLERAMHDSNSNS